MENAAGLDGLLSFLLFAGVFYLLMRFGCGAHIVHGHGRSTSTDPVCGMEVRPDRGYSKIYQGNEYRFCSRRCLGKFDDEPERYLKQKDVER